MFYVPEFIKKLISVPKLSEDGYNSTFKGISCEVTLPNGGMLSVQCSSVNLYYWNVITKQEHVWTTEDTSLN